MKRLPVFGATAGAVIGALLGWQIEPTAGRAVVGAVATAVVFALATAASLALVAHDRQVREMASSTDRIDPTTGWLESDTSADLDEIDRLNDMFDRQQEEVA